MPDLFTTAISGNLLHGALGLEHGAHGVLPHRLPRAAWMQADQQLVMAQAQPSGVRLALRTAATVVELDAHRTTMAYRGVAPRPDGCYDLLVDGELAGQVISTGGTAEIVDIATGERETRTGPLTTVRFAGLPKRKKRVEIWLPHYERIEMVALRTDAPVEPVQPGERPVWLHHGSSISQGSNATSPTAIWPALAAAHGKVELVNLGFSGSAMLDPFVARTMRDLPADLISIKIGINLVNGDVMRLRAFGPAVHGFLDTIREGHPSKPLLIISPILCPIHEDTPGPGAPDFTDGVMRFRATGDPAEVPAGKLTLRTIRQELAEIVRQRSAEDPHLHYLDGRALYGEADATELPLPDRLHPDTATHRLMSERFGALAFNSGAPFAT
ncbi:lipase [Saccharopolyspora erythraea]|uniref:GDSL-type esterase/lipase family protein n=1 Tax=Saccharopolyspora erythraea TaxID=1836 RepID=UPI001BA9AEFA|nr:GDSL-type esterase/lipase family protein [Saccharopolyspora erythraea]QUH06197.1 lipase [Saccharopolyspora erythraea]